MPVLDMPEGYKLQEGVCSGWHVVKMEDIRLVSLKRSGKPILFATAQEASEYAAAHASAGLCAHQSLPDWR